MKPLSPTLKSIARHIGTISWSGLLDTGSLFIKGAGLGVLLTLIALYANGTPFMVQITDAAGTTLYGPKELTFLLQRCADIGLVVWLLSVGVFMALTGRFIFMSRVTTAMDAAFADLIQHVPALARLARLARMRKERLARMHTERKD